MNHLCRKVLNVLAGLWALTGCAVISTPRCADVQQPAVYDEVYFGTAKPDGVVSTQAWTKFVDTEITPRFPGGFTLSQATGQWRSADGAIVHEPSNVLKIVHPGNELSETAVRDIVAIYKNKFQQEAVLRVRSQACVSF